MDTKQAVLVTGASTGFGRLIADTLARKGYTIFATMRDLAGRNAKNSSEIRALAQKESLPLHVLELDVTDEASVNRAVDSVIKTAGRIDVAINNAGYVLIGLEEAFTTEQAQKLFDTNFFGSIRVNRAVLPHMRQQRSGLLMHISSGAGRVVFPGFGLYCASKFALEALSESYSYELAGQGIESVVVQPGAYHTPVFSNVINPADPSRAESYGPTQRLPERINAGLQASAGDAQEVADAVLRILETPAGERNVRYRVSPGDSGKGIDEINAVSERVQKNLFDTFGLSADVQFRKGKAAGSV
jgi:NAD(P)-dependent dehydrogenase (short-subunit alcohol dehydrogenase family)